MDQKGARAIAVGAVLCAVVLAVSLWLNALPRIEGPRLVRFPECQEHDDPLACSDLAERFHDKCLGCHHTLSFQRVAPDLAGLLGRKRTFASGESLTADRAYIRRSIADHTDESEYIPGYAVLPDELEGASRGLTVEDVDELTTRVLHLKPHAIHALVQVTKEWSSEDPRVEDIEDLMNTTRESMRHCYQGALATDPDVRGVFEVEFRDKDRHQLAGEIVKTNVGNPIVINCVRSVLEQHDGVPHIPATDVAIARYRIEMSATPVGDQQAP